MNASTHADSAALASDTGALAKNVAGAASNSHSMLERVGEAVAAAKLGTRVLPAVWRFAKRRPVSATFATVAVIAAAYILLPRIRSQRPW